MHRRSIIPSGGTMLRRRTATLGLITAALLAASPLITSCGTAHAGAAALVGGQVITVAQLQAQVDAVRAAQNGTPQAAQLIEATSDLDRSMLGTMVSDEVLDRAVRDAGLTVTARDAQQLKDSAEQQAGGVGALSAELLQQYAVAPGAIDGFYRAQAEARAFAEHLRVDLSTPAGQQAVTGALSKTSQKLHVDVSPRYGTWNGQTLTLSTTSQPWLRKTATAGLLAPDG
jgi:hypothetical protein